MSGRLSWKEGKAKRWKRKKELARRKKKKEENNKE
jgi:hypothetical protein